MSINILAFTCVIEVGLLGMWINQIATPIVVALHKASSWH